MLVEVHEGSFGTHANGHAMARKILRAGYYWLTMESDCCIHVRKCHKCQTFANNVNASPMPVNILVALWPFSIWGIDVIGAIEPKASNGHCFILVVIDCFTKLVNAASYSSVTRSVVVRFIKKEVIYRYGLPRKIITYNATNLNNKMLKYRGLQSCSSSIKQQSMYGKSPSRVSWNMDARVASTSAI